jgi:hypothetical protein
VKGQDTCTATDGGSKTKFNVTATAFPYGVTAVVVAATGTVRADVTATTNPVFAVPTQKSCTSNLKTSFSTNLDSLYGDLDCVLSADAIKKVECTQNSTSFDDFRRHKLLEHSGVFGFTSTTSSYDSLEFTSGTRSPCKVIGSKASLVDLRDGTNDDGDNYCVFSYNSEYIRLNTYSAQFRGSSLDLEQTRPATGGGTNYALLEGDATLSVLTVACPYADELVVPESVRNLGIGFLIGLNTDADVTSGSVPGTNDFTLYVGQRLESTSSAVSIDDTANMLAADSDNVAVIRRACPTSTVSGANHPQYDDVTADYRNTYALNSVSSKVISARDVNEAKYYDSESSDAIDNCIRSGSALAERIP